MLAVFVIVMIGLLFGTAPLVPVGVYVHGRLDADMFELVEMIFENFEYNIQTVAQDINRTIYDDLEVQEQIARSTVARFKRDTTNFRNFKDASNEISKSAERIKVRTNIFVKELIEYSGKILASDMLATVESVASTFQSLLCCHPHDCTYSVYHYAFAIDFLRRWFYILFAHFFGKVFVCRRKNRLQNGSDFNHVFSFILLCCTADNLVSVAGHSNYVSIIRTPTHRNMSPYCKL